MKNSNLFIKLSCIIPALLIMCMVNLSAQNELAGYIYLGSIYDHYYYLSNCETTWDEANEAAIEMGGYLATLSNEPESWALPEWTNYYGDQAWAWIGLRAENGNYEWANGEGDYGLYEFSCVVCPDGAALIGGPFLASVGDPAWLTIYPISSEAVYIVEFPFSPNCSSNNPDKVYVCHNGNTICVNVTALQGHLDHGDLEGPCGPCNIPAMQTLPNETVATEGHSLQTATVVLSEPEEELDIVQKIPSSDQINIFPNPASEEIHVVLPEANHEGTLRILSLTGQEIYTLPLQGQHSFRLDLSDYTTGIYLIDVRSANGHYQKKIVRL